jgi:hypothetical protein
MDRSAAAFLDSVGAGQHKDTLGKSGISVEAFGQQRSNEQLLQEHEAALKKFKQKCSAVGLSAFNISTCNMDVKAPPSGSSSIPPDPSSCTVVAAKDLQASTTHRGQMLRGTLVVEPVAYDPVQTILQDEHGNLVTVSNS